MLRNRTLALLTTLVLLTALLAAIALDAGAGAAAPTAPGDLPDALDRVVTDWHERAWVPGVAVSVRHGTSFAWSGAAGVADEATNTPLRADMAFPIASVTKTFVAATVLTLVQDGLVDLDRPVTDYLPDVPWAGEVTIRQLLAMRSGIPDYTQAYGLLDSAEQDLLHGRARHWTPDELLDIVAERDPDFPPGDRFAYSNTNYLLLGEVLTAVTGQPWDQALQQRILTPLGLDQPSLPTDDDMPALAAGHADLDRDATRDSLGGLPYNSVSTMAGAAGALIADADDLTAFAHGLFHHGPLTPDTLAAMTHVDHAGYERRYGLGLFIHQPDLRTTIVGHTGSIIGYSTLLWYAPEHDLAIAVLINDTTASPEDLAELLLRQVLHHTNRSTQVPQP